MVKDLIRVISLSAACRRRLSHHDNTISNYLFLFPICILFFLHSFVFCLHEPKLNQNFLFIFFFALASYFFRLLFLFFFYVFLFLVFILFDPKTFSLFSFFFFIHRTLTFNNFPVTTILIPIIPSNSPIQNPLNLKQNKKKS